MSARIVIFGGSGCGASTLSRSVAAALGIPYFDSDDYYHGPSDPPFQNPRPPAERAALLAQDLLPTASWVLAGGVAGWDPCPPLAITLGVHLDVPTALRIERLKQRERQRFGARILPGGDMQRIHDEFLQWAARYDQGDVAGKTRQRHEALLASLPCPALRLDGTLPLAQLVDRVVAAR